jgi:hypothetical protein
MYVDPGSGSFVLQLLFGAVFAMLFHVKRFTAWCRRTPKRPRRQAEMPLLPSTRAGSSK